MKRLHKALNSKSYGEVAFNYEEDTSSKMTEEKDGEHQEEEVEGGDEPFTAPPELDIPINMVLVSCFLVIYFMSEIKIILLKSIQC